MYCQTIVAFDYIYISYILETFGSTTFGNCYALGDLLSFVQFKKRGMSVTFSKTAGWRLQLY